jgi:hypothetical protein
VSAYTSDYPLKNSYKKLYLVLDNGTLTFAADPHEGISYLVAMGVLEDRAEAIAEFIHHTTLLDWRNLERFLRERYTCTLLTVHLSSRSYNYCTPPTLSLLPDKMCYRFW